ncbi:hypothetical protein BpHYR1_006314, partial [Brachionus plicatilis]
ILINNKKKNQNKQLHNGVGYSIYLDSKPSLYSFTSLSTNGIERLSPVPTYLSLNSKSRFETPHDTRCWRDKEKNNLKLIRLRIYKDFLPIIAAFFNFVYLLSLSFLYLEKTTEHDFSTDIFIFHLISHCSSSLVPLFVINEECY